MEERAEEPTLAAGTAVEVMSSFDLGWKRGFEIAEVVISGYRVRRRSDGSVLPHVFPAESVREERQRRQGLWWY